MTEPLHSIGGEPLQPGVDLAGLAIRALALGATLGGALQCLVLWGTRMLTANAPPSDVVQPGGLFWFVILGTMASMGAGGATSWSLLAQVGSPWRRAGLSAIAAFATLVVAALAVPIDVTFGPPALLVAAIVLGVLAFWSGRAVAAWHRDPG